MADKGFKLVQHGVKQGRVGGHRHCYLARLKAGRHQGRGGGLDMGMATGDYDTARAVDHADDHIIIGFDKGGDFGLSPHHRNHAAHGLFHQTAPFAHKF